MNNKKGVDKLGRGRYVSINQGGCQVFKDIFFLGNIFRDRVEFFGELCFDFLVIIDCFRVGYIIKLE